MDGTLQFVAVGIDKRSDGTELIGLGAPDAAVYAGISRLEVEIDARLHGFTALRANASAEIGFVGCLIGFESYVAIDAIGTVAGSDAAQLRPRVGEEVDKALQVGEPRLAKQGVTLLIGIEPIAVVIFTEFA